MNCIFCKTRWFWLSSMTATLKQEILFRRIKEMLPPDISFADTISDALNISIDSAYRRIRGETLLVLEEAATLCKYFNLSLDQLLETTTNDILFRNVRIKDQQYTFLQYLQEIYFQLKALDGLKEKEIIYMSKDLPIFHNFYFRPLLAFRYFFWMKTHLQHPDFQNQQFRFNLLPEQIEKLSKELVRVYCKIPTTEMWNRESINSTISQIEFSRDSGHFKNTSDIRLVYDALEETINHIKRQAENGYKYMPDDEPRPDMQRAIYKFYFNRVVLGDNTIMIIADSVKSSIINYGKLYYLETRDEGFCNDLYSDFITLIKKSTQISQTSEKQRNIFFNGLLSKIQDRKNSLLKHDNR